jgi:hypothetical protein
VRARCLAGSCVLVWIAAAPRAQALFTFPHRDNDGADQIIVTGTYSIGEDTNVFAQRVKKAAITQTAAAEADYTRRAGLISVEASVAMNVGAFIGLSGQDYADPSFTLAFTKGQGRTTGTLTFTAAKSNAPDPVANNRAVAWNYSESLSLRYPLFDRYSFSDTSTVGGTSYQNMQIFSDQQIYSNSLALNVIYDSKLTLDTAYHIGLSETKDTNNISQGFTFGGTGTLLPKLTGTIDVGYGFDAAYTKHEKEQEFTSLNGDASLKWAFSRSLSFSADATKAFGISSTDVVTNTTSGGVAGSGNIGKRFRTDLGIRYVGTNFVSTNGLGRKDTLIEVPADLGTALTTHVRVNLNYTWMENYSNLSSGKFVRETITLTLIATY